MSMWTVTPEEIRRFQSNGEAFTQFVDTVLAAILQSKGLSLAHLHTNQRVMRKDGGVDSKLDIPIPTFDQEWFAAPTAWQYKSSPAKGIGRATLRNEIEKPYAQDLIKAGFAYRYVICDELDVRKRDEWTRWLTDAAKAINPQCPDPYVITTSNLAALASRFPAIKTRFFWAGGERIQSFDLWGANITHDTPEYADTPEREHIIDSITSHTDLGSPTDQIILKIEGPAGVGKSRLTFEALRRTARADLVLYTNDESQARTTAVELSHHPSVHAVLVADDCSLEAVRLIGETIQSSADRVRVVAISTPESRSRFSEKWLDPMKGDSIDSLLEKNFSIPADRRRIYQELAAGFPRLAILLASNDEKIMAGNFLSTFKGIEEFLLRFGMTEPRYQPAIMALSLVMRLGVKQDVEEEGRQLCTLLDLDFDEFRQVSLKIKNSKGLVAEAGRYLYVTPAAVAAITFDWAWTEWIEHDTAQFLQRLASVAPLVLDTFLRRVAQDGNMEVRRRVGDFFRDRVASFDPADLSDPTSVKQLLTFVEAKPDDYMPLLARVVADASPGQIMAVTGEHKGGWGSRRQLVWFTERVAAFPEYFRYAEQILWKLACFETEPGIGNNATAQWSQLFKMFLSGTAVPYNDRLPVLKERVEAADERMLGVALETAATVFGEYAVRTESERRFAGRIAPEEWQPKINAELWDAQKDILELFENVLKSGPEWRRAIARKILISHAWQIVQSGGATRLRDLLSLQDLPDEEKTELVTLLREFMEKYSEEAKEKGALDYLASLSEWIDSLLPNDVHGTILSLISERWIGREKKAEADWQANVRKVTSEMLAEQSLTSELSILNKARPHEAFSFGRAAGEFDEGKSYLATIVANAGDTGQTSFAAGYVVGLLSRDPSAAAEVHDLIDAAAEDHPLVAFELSAAGGHAVGHVDRAVSMAERRLIPPSTLRSLSYWHAELERDDFVRVLAVLADLDSDEGRAVGVQMLDHRLNHSSDADGSAADERIRALSWRLLVSPAHRMESYHWKAVLSRLAPHDLERVISLAIDILIEGEFGAKDDAETLLIELLEQDRAATSRAFLQALEADELPIRAAVNTFRHLVQKLPLNIVDEWLHQTSTLAVRRFARHLSSPYISPEGEPIVPDLTALVLREFEDDDEVFQSFYSGTHHLRMYSGDLAKRHQQEAEAARPFLNHHLRRVREWAQTEIEHGESQARWWRRKEEEFDLPE